jgi:hypothetical protein
MPSRYDDLMDDDGGDDLDNVDEAPRPLRPYPGTPRLWLGTPHELIQG